MSKKGATTQSAFGGVAVLIIFLFPILYLTYFRFTYDPTNVPRFLLLSVFLLGAVWLLKDFAEKSIAVKFVNLTLIGFYVWSLLSFTWSLSGSESIFQTQKHFIFILSIFLFSSLIKKNSNIPIYISRSLLFLVPIILLVFIKELNVALHKNTLDQYTMYLVPGLSAHKNLLSAYLFFMSSFFILGYFTDHSKWKKFYLPSFVIVFTIILILLTRAVYVAFLSFVLVSIFSAWYIKFKTKTIIKLDGWKNLVVAMAISIALFITFYASFSKTQYAAQQANPAGYIESTTANERLALWYYSAKMFIKHPIAGVGSGNWKMVLPEQSLKGLYRAQYENLVFLQPHNDYLWIICELGVIGLLLFAIPLILIFKRGIKTLSEVNSTKQLTLLILISTVAGWATISMFDFPKERTELVLFSGTCLGLIYGFSKNETEKVFFNIPWKFFRTGITLLLILNIVIGLYRLSGEIHFVAMNKYQKQNNLELVIAEANKAKSIFMQMDPLTSPFDLYIARAHAAQGRTDLAFEFFENALAINPNAYSCLNNFAGTYVKAGQYEKAIPLYLRAQFIYPDLEDGMFNISYTYSQAKQFDLAEEWVRKVKKNTKRKDAFLIKIEESRKR